MNPEIKEQWLAALRSGDYTQGQHALKVGAEYCCLGVLCDLAVKNGVEVEVRQGPGGVDDYTYYDGESGTLPTSVREWAGLSSSNPITQEGFDTSLYRKVLAELNDGGYTFARIADVIERDL